jgi:hypothetical protein
MSAADPSQRRKTYHRCEALLPQSVFSFSVFARGRARALGSFSVALSGGSLCSVPGSHFAVEGDFGNPAVAMLETLCHGSNSDESAVQLNDSAANKRPASDGN